jgi:hypothetical protein
MGSQLIRSLCYHARRRNRQNKVLRICEEVVAPSILFVQYAQPVAVTRQ